MIESTKIKLLLKTTLDWQCSCFHLPRHSRLEHKTDLIMHNLAFGIQAIFVNK